MNKISAADVLELSIPERIQLVEDIWDTIAAKANALELTEEERSHLTSHSSGWLTATAEQGVRPTKLMP